MERFREIQDIRRKSTFPKGLYYIDVAVNVVLTWWYFLPTKSIFESMRLMHEIDVTVRREVGWEASQVSLRVVLRYG